MPSPNMIPESIKDLTRELNHATTEFFLFSWELGHDFGPFVPLQRFEGSLFSTLDGMQSINTHLTEFLDLAYAEQWMRSQHSEGKMPWADYLKSTKDWLEKLSSQVIAPLRECLYMNEDDSDKVDAVVADVKGRLLVLSDELHEIVYAVAPANWGTAVVTTALVASGALSSAGQSDYDTRQRPRSPDTVPFPNCPSAVSSLETRALNDLQRHFGADPKWQNICRAVWRRFKELSIPSIKPSDVDKIASHCNSTPDDVFAVLGLCSRNASGTLIMEYVQIEGGEETKISPQIAAQWLRNAITWQSVAASIFVRWSPRASD